VEHQFEPYKEVYYQCARCHLIVRTTNFTGGNAFVQELAVCQEQPVYQTIPKELANKSWFTKQALETTAEIVGYYVNPTHVRPAFIGLYPKNTARPKAKKRPTDATYRRAARAVGIVIKDEEKKSWGKS